MKSLIDDLIAEQQFLTPVARFSRKHEAHDLPAQSRYYRDLIPLSLPGEGEQYAFAVDLDACTGCKGCVSACHSLNGLDETESWRDAGVIFGGTVIEPFQQTVTAACHHCVDPACLNGCPVMAYDKDPVTGIVHHLDDQCIGCQYCVLKCPYDVPKYNARLGIVRKCDMCSSRLGVNEAPACVQACPNEAIRIETVPRDSVIARAELERELVPGAFDSDYTKPTTRYFSNREMPKNLAPGHAHDLTPEHAHLPLVLMLTLTQWSVGAFLVNLTVSSRALAVTALVIGLIGLGASILHLGRPFGAWRAFLGLRTSWLSREVVTLGMFAKIAIAAVAVQFLPVPNLLESALALAAAAVGMAGVFCSAMVYADTRRPFWKLRYSAGKFFGTTLLLGAGTAVAFAPEQRMWALVWAGIAVAKLAAEAGFLHRARSSDDLHRSVRLLLGPLRCATRARFVFGAVVVVMASAIVLGLGGWAPWTAWLALGVCAAGEFLERYLYFTAVTAPRMPRHFSTS